MVTPALVVSSFLFPSWYNSTSPSPLATIQFSELLPSVSACVTKKSAALFISIFVAVVLLIKLLVPLCDISKSPPVPNLYFTLSLLKLSPVKVFPVVDAKLPLAVTPPCQAPPL